MNPEELRAFVVEHEGEILRTLYLLACERWANAHIETSKAEAESAVLSARVLVLQGAIEHYKRTHPEKAAV